MMLKLLWWLVAQLDCQRVVVITDNTTEGEQLSAAAPASKLITRYTLTTSDDVMSGDWLRDVVTTGDDSWQPAFIVMMCSISCVSSALRKASRLQEELGTQTAFAMTSRWLWLKTGNDYDDIRQLDIKNITMDNVAIFDSRQFPMSVKDNRTCLADPVPRLEVKTLMWTPEGRGWSQIRCRTLPDWPLPMDTSSLADGARQSGSDVGSSTPLDEVLFPNVKHGFNGRRLRVITKEWLSYVNSARENGTTVWSGLLLDLIELFSQTLNFTYDLVEPEDGQWGTGTASDPQVGLYGQVINKKVDIGLGASDILDRRAQFMDFSYPVVFTPVVMVYRKPALQKWWVLFNPLSTHLMLAVGGALVAVTLCVSILEMLEVKLMPGAGNPRVVGLRRCQETVRVVERVFQLTGGAVVLKPTAVMLLSRPARILILSWWMLTLVVTSAFSGTLTAFLSVTKQTQLFSSPRDLVAKQHDYQWGTVGGSGFTVLLENSNDTSLQRIWDGIRRFAASDPDVISPDVNVLIAKVKRENFVLFQTAMFAVEAFGGDCGVETVNARIKEGMTAIVFPKGSALTTPLSHIIERLHSSGLLAQWTQRWFPGPPAPPPGPHPISLPHLTGPSLLLPLGLALALLVLLLETLGTRYTHR